MRAAGRSLLIPLAWSVVAAATAAAQTESRIAIMEESDGLAVGIAVVLNAGAVWEMPSEAGVTHLTALSILERVRPAVERLGGTASVVCGRANIGFTAVLPPDRWAEGAELLLDRIFEEEPNDRDVLAARESLLERLLVAEGNPAHEIRETTFQALFGPGHHWAQPPCGRAEAVDALEPADARRVARTRFRPNRATAAIAGPIDEGEARRILRSALGEADLPVLLPPPPPGREGAEERVRRNTVTSWIALAFPATAPTDAESLLLLATRIRESVAPAASRPDVHDLDITLERHGGGGALVVHMITEPERADRWAREVGRIVGNTARGELPDDRFDELVRRHRGARLLSLDSPESRALDAAVQLFFDSGYDPLPARLESLTAESLREAASSLGNPVTAVVGPG